MDIRYPFKKGDKNNQKKIYKKGKQKLYIMSVHLLSVHSQNGEWISTKEGMSLLLICSVVKSPQGNISSFNSSFDDKFLQKLHVLCDEFLSGFR